jgi:aspartate aminotransferase-like enzyme
MLQVGPYIFKHAETDEEFEQIHALNFRTFVNEIPQHPNPGNNGHLVDKFHHKNAYIITVQDRRVIGMVCTHDQPPFSVADRLCDPGILHQPGMRPFEVRLLAIEPDKRNSTVFFGMMWALYDFAERQGYTHMFISGIQKRVPMYKRLGFEVLGPAVPSGGAMFVPMVMTIGKLPPDMVRLKQQWETHMDRDSNLEWVRHDPAAIPKPGREVCLLPGPVTVAPSVHHAFRQPPIYHRGPEFINLFRKVRQTLGDMVGGRDVALFNGSGTLANEAVAACLAADPQPGRGLLLVNGEFGTRLARQATRFGLTPRLLAWPWGQPWDLNEVAAALADEPPGSWVWGVHLESSTGVLNDLDGLVHLAQARGIRVCADCISSLGAVRLNLKDVYLATGATGKSLGSYAGLAIVFANAPQMDQLDMSRVPSYFDIPAVLRSEGPRYTFPSPTVCALDAALAEYSTPAKARLRYDHYAAMGAEVREQLRNLDLVPIAAEDRACPVVTTFAPPGNDTSAGFVSRCGSWGFAIGGQSQYLAERRLVQIATMGAVKRQDCMLLFERLGRWLGQLDQGPRQRRSTSVTA